MHMPPKQQPLLQVLPAQHGAPVVPQTWHRPEEDELDEHTVPAAQRSAPFAPEQHCTPGLPQGEQMLPLQARPAPQLLPQQGCPEEPQPAHLPPLHRPGLVPPVPPLPDVVVPQAVPSATQVSL